jgi:quercetin dioxygenase-like cupin family protein
MDQQSFETALKSEGYDVQTSTTPGAKVNPEHSHPFDIRAMVLKGAVTLNCNGTVETYRPGQVFTMARGCLHFESYGAEGAKVLVGRKN